MTTTRRLPTSEELDALRSKLFHDLQVAQHALDKAAQEHTEFRAEMTRRATRRDRADGSPMLARKQELRAQLNAARKHRDALLTDPLTCEALTPRAREAATGLSREGRRYIERAHGVRPTHPHYAHAHAREPQPPTAPTREDAPTNHDDDDD
jgi:hypothetical protein